jgi:hypothetical protein
MAGKRLSAGLRLSVAGLLATGAAAAAGPARADAPPGSISVYTQDMAIGYTGPGADFPIDANGATGAGSVTVVHGSPGPAPTGPDVYDTDWSNNTAAVTINP